MESQQPRTRAELLVQSDLLIERRRLDQARALLAQELKSTPDDGELLYRFALIDYVEDEDDSALGTIDRLLTHTPSHYGGRFLQAEILQRRNRFADAETIWLGLLRDFPESAGLYAAYARLMLSTLNLDKAQRLAAEALRLEPQNDAALFVMGISDLITGKQGQHSRHIETLVREHPEDARATIALILALQDRRDSAGALRLAQELLHSHPTDENYVELVRELKVENHWSMLPLYPVRRWGWGGSIAVWAVGIVSLNVLQGVVSRPVMAALLIIWFAYVAYSWIWPAQLKRFL